MIYHLILTSRQSGEVGLARSKFCSSHVSCVFHVKVLVETWLKGESFWNDFNWNRLVGGIILCASPLGVIYRYCVIRCPTQIRSDHQNIRTILIGCNTSIGKTIMSRREWRYQSIAAALIAESFYLKPLTYRHRGQTLSVNWGYISRQDISFWGNDVTVWLYDE